jgi:hypothetical protein
MIILNYNQFDEIEFKIFFCIKLKIIFIYYI